MKEEGWGKISKRRRLDGRGGRHRQIWQRKEWSVEWKGKEINNRRGS